MSKQSFHKNQGFAQGAILVLVGVLIGVIGYLLYSNQQVLEQLEDFSSQPTEEAAENFIDETNQENDEVVTVEETELSPAQESYSEPAGDGVLRYVSPRLGVSFVYQESVQLGQATQEFEVTETGNKIYIHDSNLVDETGEPMLGAKYVEVLDKAPGLTLDQALSTRYNLAANDKCQIEQLQGDFGLEPSYETAVISFVQEAGVEYDLPELMTAVEDNCPTPYTPVGGIAYFMMNPAAAGRMAFVSVGQDCLPSGEVGVCWHETMRLFE